MNQNLKISGHSGFKVELFSEGNKSFIQKSSSVSTQNNRLKLQIDKQKLYTGNSDIIVPKIIESKENKLYSYKMEYFNCYDFVEFLNQTSTKEIEIYVNILIEFINNNIQKSEYQIILPNIIIDKYDLVKSNINLQSNIPYYIKNKILSYTDNYFELFEDKCIKGMYLPVGFCHGDLTLSNILFHVKSKKLVFIDFLDSFIETPLNDIVKLRQDTKFLWSLCLYKGIIDKVKMKIAMNHLDKKITQCFIQHDFFNNWYSTFELLNLLRVLQYAKDRKIIKHLELCILKD